jgi:hypothetical protein
MHTDGIWFKDEDGRTLLLRGANLGSTSKLPTRPNGATYRRDGFSTIARSRSSAGPFRWTRPTSTSAVFRRGD